MSGGGRDACRLHLAYLERDGVERGGSPGRLYGPDESFDATAFNEPLKGEKRQWRFIVSPEDGRAVDLHAFAREFMAQVEEDLGGPLMWTAVNHHNTDHHPHVHFVIRGVHPDGKDVRFTDRYIQRDMRARAEHILTRELGLRTEVDIAKQRTKEIGQERRTSLDRRLAPLASSDGEILARSLAKLRPEERSAILARLGTLVRLGLARSGPRGSWQLVADWQKALEKLGLRNDIIKRLHSVAGGDVARYRFVEPKDLTRPIEGIVRGKGLHDELKGEMFVAVETAAGETHYVHLDPRVDPLAADWLRAGDVVRVVQATESWTRPTDHAVARVVAVVADGPRQQERLRPVIEGRAGTWEALPADSFKEQGTSVRTALIVVEARS